MEEAIVVAKGRHDIDDNLITFIVTLLAGEMLQGFEWVHTFWAETNNVKEVVKFLLILAQNVSG